MEQDSRNYNCTCTCMLAISTPTRARSACTCTAALEWTFLIMTTSKPECQPDHDIQVYTHSAFANLNGVRLCQPQWRYTGTSFFEKTTIPALSSAQIQLILPLSKLGYFASRKVKWNYKNRMSFVICSHQSSINTEKCYKSPRRMIQNGVC